MSTELSWQFRVMSRNEMNADPVQAEFFSDEGGRAHDLVREAIQNSLDARLRHEPVHVTFRIGHATIADDAEDWFRGLGPHLEATVGVDASILRAPPKYLAIEDFGTSGLRGDPEAYKSTGEKNDFFFFWRNVGRSSKSESDRGRWGLGKTVLPATSQISSFFAMTLRPEETRPLLMGQSVLRIHELNDTQVAPYGYFADFDEDGFALPTDLRDDTERFTRAFHLERGDRPGLSVVIPYPSEDITRPNLVAAVIRHFFVALIHGDLVATVVDEERTVKIDNHSVEAVLVTLPREVMSDAEKERFRQGLSFVRWAISTDDLADIQVRSGGASQWSDVSEAFDFKTARERFGREGRIAFRVALPVRLANGTELTGEFKAFFEEDDSGETHELYVRQGLSIPGIRRVKKRGLRCLLLVGGGPLARILGDSENPAHSDWSERAARVRDGYEYGASTVRFVRNALTVLASALTETSTVRNYDVFKEVFSIPEVKKPRSTERKGERPVIPGGKPQGFRVSQTADGFVIAADGNGTLPNTIEVEVAYDTTQGNPFNSYSREDFVLSSSTIFIAAKNASCRPGGNTAEISVDSGFSVKFSGFDPNRDLVVRAVRKGD